MSTDRDAKIPDALARQAQQQLAQARAEEEQLELLDPLSPEEMAEAQEHLGPGAGQMAVLREARARRRGRPKGSPNRRNADTVSWLAQFGPDPLKAAMAILATPLEVLVERSYAIDPVKRRMSYGDALNAHLRVIEFLGPYMHGKQPVKVDATIRGVIVQEQIGDLSGARGITLDAEPLGLLPLEGDGE